MITVDQIETLKEKHASLEQAIDQEISRPHPDDGTVHSLKKRKLQVKDRLLQLSASPTH